MSRWEEIRRELEQTQKRFTNDQFLDFVTMGFALKEMDKDLLYKSLVRQEELEREIGM